MELGRSAPMLMAGFAWSGGGDGAGAGRAQPATGSSPTIAKVCSTDSGGALPRSLSAAAAADRKDQRNLAALTLRAALTRARDGADSRALGGRPTCTGRLGGAAGCWPTSTVLFSGIVVGSFGGGRWSSGDRRRC